MPCKRAKNLKHITLALTILFVFCFPAVLLGINVLYSHSVYADETIVIDPPVKDPALDCENNSGGLGQAVDADDEQNSTNKDCDLVAKYINPIIIFLSGFVGLAVTIGLITGGIQYASAGGDPGKVQKAKGIIRASIVALLVFLFLWALLGWLQPGGVKDGFSGNPPPTTKTRVTPRDGGSVPPTGGGGGGVGTPAPTQITSLNGVSNFRDAGASGFLKTGVLYRSGNLENANATQVSQLLNGGLIIDLRSKSVIKDAPDVVVPGVDALNTPIHGTEDYTEFVLLKASRDGFRDAITAIANADGDVLVHCTHGKDRTGWTVAMIMYAMGASDAQVMNEYLKSPDVSKSMLNTGLSLAREKYGSINNYLRSGLGLSDQTINQLKSKLAG